MNVVCKKCQKPKVKGKECKACRKAYNMAYYLSNKDKAKSKARDWKRKNKEKVQANKILLMGRG